MIRRTCFAFGLLSASASVATQEASPAPAVLPPPTRAVAFKSGHAWLRREFDVDPAETEATVLLPDGAVHGSVWLDSDSVALQRCRAYVGEAAREQPVRGMADLLRASVGRSVELGIQRGGNYAVERGRIAAILDGGARAPEPVQAAYSVIVSSYYPGTAAPSANPLVVIEGERGRLTLPVASVVELRDAAGFPGSTPLACTRLEQVPMLGVRYAAPSPAAPRARVGLEHVSTGLSWAPSYVLELREGGRARLIGKSVVANDGEPLVSTRLQLAIGFPSFAFVGVPSSLSPTQSIEAFRRLLQSGGRSENPATRSQISSVNMNMISAQTAAQPGSLDATTLPADGEAAGELYLYDMGPVTLASGERAYLPLLDQEIDFEHVYDWSLEDRIDANLYFRRPERTEEEPVWHELHLKNASGTPWTTAPILIRGENGPVAQSTLTYTPTASTTPVRVTKALDLVAHAEEARVDKDAKQERRFGDLFQVVTIEGRLRVTNRKREAVPVRVHKRLSGDLLSTDGEPDVVNGVDRIRQANVSRVLNWKFELEAGATWTAAYRYRARVRL